MRGNIIERLSHWANFLVVAMLIITLALLSWGITSNNLWATMLAGSLLALVIVFGGSVVLVPDDIRSQAMGRTMHVASSMLESMRDGLTAKSCNDVCQIILPETEAQGISLTDTATVLGYAGEVPPEYPPGSPNSGATLEVLRTGRMETFTKRNAHQMSVQQIELDTYTPTVPKGFPVGIIVPLIVADKAVGTLKLYYRNGQQVDRTQLTIARGFANLISVQLSSYELDRQAELTARAEVKALQAQINPHFLFNTLNTIAAFTRTDPTRARDLLREFALFYRRTLESSESRITLAQELEQTRRYLVIEKARFGDDRIVESEYLEAGLEDVMVPSFLVQPIVENSVRHAMRDEGPLHIDIHATVDGNDVLIAVADDGLGMDEEAKELLLASAHMNHDKSGGTGIALRNVAERIERFYGGGSGIEIMSKLGEGTVVTLRIAGAGVDVKSD